MSKVFKKKWKEAAKKSRRILIAATAGAVAFGSIGYAQAASVEDVFDEQYYADEYPDLKAAYGYDRTALLKHFMMFGLAEGRVMNEMIDIVKYKEIYKDLQAAFGDDWDAYIEHYLRYGAFEQRDSGTDFDPVDYLNRYTELQAAFGNDLLAAYEHYKQYGKQEGREGRSESSLNAEKMAAQSNSPAESSEENPESPEESSEPSNPSGPSEPSEPGKNAFAIQSVEVVGDGHIRVTLNQKTEQALTLEAFSIICNSGGSDMTIRSVTTNDNMVYNLSTTYYRDQEYDIQITLPDGTAISKVFSYRTDCAHLASMNAVRTSASEARITYTSDQPGYFYYILRENGQAVAQAASTEVTEADIIRDGVKTEMKQHENAFNITGLAEGMPYTMYYVAVNTEGKSTLVSSLSIAGDVHAGNAAAIQRAEAFAEKLENGEYLYGFEIELETATPESLVLEQFQISCPSSETTLGEVRTSDNKVYRVYMQRGNIPAKNNTYTILITLNDGTQINGSCYLDLQAPNAYAEVIEWKDADTIVVTVNSDEAGTLYYAVQDEVEGAGTTAPKDPAQIYANGSTVSMGYGWNYITINGAKAGQWFCYATEDERGNREDFYSYKTIPEYTEPAPDDTSKPEITDVTVLSASNSAKLKVVFNQTVFGLYDNSQTQISGIDKRPSFFADYDSEGGLEDNVLILTMMDSGISIPAGEHTLTIVFTDGKTATFNFTV